MEEEKERLAAVALQPCHAPAADLFRLALARFVGLLLRRKLVVVGLETLTDSESR